ncbi:MAG: hypothetical protein FWB78_06920 [Treponema sp.]|nr:hypothetical protein [Treponema sp.]
MAVRGAHFQGLTMGWRDGDSHEFFYLPRRVTGTFLLPQEEINMLANEWDMEIALEVREEEGFEKGMEMNTLNNARNALAKGLPIELIHEITGLDTETITGLSQKAL